MRNLSDYYNDDGLAPNGLDDYTDDSGALRRALADGPGIVQIEPGFYRFSEVCVPGDVILQGSGRSTVIRSGGAAAIFLQEHVYRWTIRDMTFDGEAEGDWHDRSDLGFSGIRIERCKAYTITDIQLQNFNGAALRIRFNDVAGPGVGWCDGGNLDRITAQYNYIGVFFDERGEYGNTTQLSCYYNVIGCMVYAGNVKLTASNFSTNRTGLYIEDRSNGSHGSISNCLINHNEEVGLHCRKAFNGMTISNCCVFTGGIILEECTGINLTSGIISCDVRVSGEKANRIAGNYIIPGKYSFEVSPSTLMQDNFTEQGAWERNSG